LDTSFSFISYIALMEEFSILILGIKITEPLGTLTDLFVTDTCLFAFIKFKKLNRKYYDLKKMLKLSLLIR